MIKILKISFTVFIAFVIYLRSIKIDEQLSQKGSSSTELTQVGDLLTPSGTLTESGWARKTIKNFNTQSISLYNRLLRLKKWDYFHVTTPDFYLAIAFVDLGYVQSLQFTYYSLEQGAFVHRDALLLPHKKQFQLNDSSVITTNQTHEYNSKEISAAYKGWLHKDVEMRAIMIEFEGFSATFVMQAPPQDDMVTIKAFNEEGDKFFYSRKAYNWHAYGQVQGKSFTDGNGGMDWGRGIFNYNTFWIWVSGMGNSNGRKIGFNLGAGNDGGVQSSSDEAIFVDNILHKVEGLNYEFDLNDLKKDIRIWGQDLEIIFEPKSTNLHEQDLLLVDVKFRQLIGTFKGRYQNIEFNKIVGIVELNRAKW